VCLLGYGVIYEKKGGEISQQKKITWLSILTLGLSALMVLIQYNELSALLAPSGSDPLIGNAAPWGALGTASEGTIYITQNGIYGIDSTILGVKFIVLLSSMGVLGMS